MTVAADREAPFGPLEREFLARHFDYLRNFVGKELTGRESEEFDRVTSPDSDESLLAGDEAELTCLVTICHAVKA
jgi:hypothetical protein